MFKEIKENKLCNKLKERDNQKPEFFKERGTKNNNMYYDSGI